MLSKDQVKRLAKIDGEELELTTERFNLGVTHMTTTQMARWDECERQAQALRDERKTIIAAGRAKPAPVMVPQEPTPANIGVIS